MRAAAPKRAGAEAVSAVRDELTRAGVALKDDETSLATYGHDESGLDELLPQLVAFPTDTAQVQAVLRSSLRHAVPVTPVGARTGKSGGSLPVLGGVSLSLERMNRILEIHPADGVAIVQPGVVLGDLHAAVEAKGLFYPPDPNSHATCTLGGNVAENAGGPRALKYGVTRDYVLGMEWVLPSGEAVRIGRRTHKGVAGFDLVGLFVGSEGTLGVATEVTLELIPLPRVVRAALLQFKDVETATAAVHAVLGAGLLPRALELLDDVALGALRKAHGAAAGILGDAGAVVLVEVDGSSDDTVLAELARVCGTAEANGAAPALVAPDDARRRELWAVRAQTSKALRALTGAKLSEDIVVPRSRLPEAIARFKAAGAAQGLTIATYGHAGDGNLHTNVCFPPGERAKADQVVARILEITVELGGTITGEHGVGLSKRDYVQLEQNAALLALQQQLKAFFDPSGLLNPGKLWPPRSP